MVENSDLAAPGPGRFPDSNRLKNVLELGEGLFLFLTVTVVLVIGRVILSDWWYFAYGIGMLSLLALVGKIRCVRYARDSREQTIQPASAREFPVYFKKRARLKLARNQRLSPWEPSSETGPGAFSVEDETIRLRGRWSLSLGAELALQTVGLLMAPSFPRPRTEQIVVMHVERLIVQRHRRWDGCGTDTCLYLLQTREGNLTEVHVFSEGTTVTPDGSFVSRGEVERLLRGIIPADRISETP